MATDRQIEAAAQAIYELDPFVEGGEYVDGFAVSPSGSLTWEQAKQRDAEFADDPRMGSVTEFAFKAARAALADVVIVPNAMTDEMMLAGQRYLDRKSLRGSHYLPATFLWYEFWQAILAAAPKSA
jgi:hypothetical protein